MAPVAALARTACALAGSPDRGRQAGKAAQFTRGIDPAKRKAATCRAAMLPDHGSSQAKRRFAPKLLRSPKSPKLDEAPRRAMVPEAEACASSAEA
jgi:hypothetical protein